LIIKAKQTRPLLAGTTIFFLLCSTILPLVSVAGELQGFRAAGRKQARMFYPRPGRHMKTLPRGHWPVKVGSRHYRFHKGVFYRPGPGGFVVVGAPIGARIHALPAAAVMVKPKAVG